MALRIITVAVLAGLVITGFAVVPHGGRPLPTGPGALRRPDGPAQQAGLRLLNEAARACRLVPYKAVEDLHWRNPAGPGASAVKIWHARGGQTFMKTVGGDFDSIPEVQRIIARGTPASASMLAGTQLPGMSERQVTLLGANYWVAPAGVGRVASRRALVVTASRPDGSLAARFWLDDRTKLPLRRQTFDLQGRIISDAVFAELTLTGPRGAVSRLAGVDAPRAPLARLRALGWPLPARLPGNLTLLEARENSAAAGTAVDLVYSDGLSEVSIIVQRGHLPPDLGGWSEATLGGHGVYTDESQDRSVAWSADGFVYLVIAAAPQQIVERVVAALPHEERPGLLSRIGRGLRRLLSSLSM
jgi:sigma-E factor negative regulatory protein RseB